MTIPQHAFDLFDAASIILGQRQPDAAL